MRMWVQVRSSTTGRGERWGQSVYLDETFRTVEVFFDRFQPLGATSSATPPLDAVDALLLVVDTLNSRPVMPAGCTSLKCGWPSPEPRWTESCWCTTPAMRLHSHVGSLDHLHLPAVCARVDTRDSYPALRQVDIVRAVVMELLCTNGQVRGGSGGVLP